ncbi:MAG: hypothetical protein ACRDO2_03045 [Nocardioidaceae bacterium]
MIFTSRFGALAARPNFRETAPEQDLDRELDELLKDADLESARER